MTSLTPEMIEKAKAAKSAKELLTLAKENNIEMTEEEAESCFAKLNPKSSELSDEKLSDVTGATSAAVYLNWRYAGDTADKVEGNDESTDEEVPVTNCSNSGHIKHDCTGGII